MVGAINFPMTDVYGGFAGTTEYTVPEAEDQNALVDDQKATDTVNITGASQKRVFLSIALVLIVIVVLGGVKRGH